MSRAPPVPFLDRWALHLENKSDPVPLLHDASDEELGMGLLDRRGLRRRMSIPGAAVLATGACVGIILLVPPFTDLAQQFVDTQFRNGSLGVEVSLASSTAGLLEVLPYPDDLGALANYPIALVRTVLTPHPFYVLFAQDPASIVASLNGVIWHLTLPLAVLGVWRGRGDARVLVLALWVVATLLVLAVPVVALIGAPLRWRIPIMAFYLCLAGSGIAAARTDPTAKRAATRLMAGWGMVVLALLAAYVYVLG